MNKNVKTALIVTGTAVATGVALNYITDGAVKDSLVDLFHNTKDVIVDTAEDMGDIVEE